VPTAGLRAVELLAGHIWPKVVHAASERAPPGCLVPFVYGWVRVDAVHRIGRHGHWHWVPGGAHDSIHWRD